MGSFVELSGVGKTYQEPHGRTVIVENFDLNIAKGECVSLLGHEGCGKSTILTMVAGLTAITDGGILVDGHGVEGPGADRRVLFSSPGLLPWMTVFDNVMLSVHQSHRDASGAQCEAIVDDYVRQLGLSEVRSQKAMSLTLAAQQRVGLARALALNPKMLLLDEPFELLDPSSRMDLQTVLLDLHARHSLTTLMITRDIEEALLLSDRVVLMTDGPKATVGKIFDVPFERPRVRADVLSHPRYGDLQQQITAFLDEESRTHAA
ncbi:Bicarbonate transport ATP-binding protein CmpD [Rosistilla carotiformis]|uniref:Bicarbonate transport ATP-binding protein CmpD n=1 Tax=Rosistilla carotiformis TaxID=2528017 RepID=A0A518JP01_9BACT|nr:ABC transporter ATP-binding protein [Rosistilla carotiformis]QDV67277.1 Bicarbonate transport ATP-binding protein CmpD [Rosistilla carotiformis]